MNKFVQSAKDFQRRFAFCRTIEAVLLSCLGAFNSILELVTVTALIPLILLIISPETITQGKILGVLYGLSGAESSNEFAVMLAGVLVFFFTLKLIAGILIWLYEFKVIHRWRLRILARLFEIVVHAKYLKVQSQDSSALIEIISSSVPYIVTHLFHNLIILVNTFLMFLFLLMFSFMYSARTILIACLFGLVLIYIFTSYKKKRMKVLGKENQELAQNTISILQKSIFGLKETKMSLKQTYFTEKFKKFSDIYAKKALSLQFTQNLPTLVVEYICLITILLVFIYLLLVNTDVSKAATEISVLIFVGIRLIPLMNRVISAVTMMASCEVPAGKILALYDRLSLDGEQRPEENIEPLQFKKALSLQNVTFSYDGDTNNAALRDVSLSIMKGQHIGFVGPSGAGKSSIINILLGFLIPQSGALLVDNQKITTKNINNMRKVLSFVDQAPFLMNDTYIGNIAYGEEEQNIDLDRVQACLTKVGLWDHVQNSTNEMKFKIGEHGKFLSGGQKQRLAIARALYKNAKIIILDESSSSLDMDSEAQLSDLLESLKGDVTIISVAHRLSTLKCCDEVIFVEAGTIQARGDFQGLYNKSEAFRRYIEYSNIRIDKSEI